MLVNNIMLLLFLINKYFYEWG